MRLMDQGNSSAVLPEAATNNSSTTPFLASDAPLTPDDGSDSTDAPSRVFLVVISIVAGCLLILIAIGILVNMLQNRRRRQRAMQTYGTPKNLAAASSAGALPPTSAAPFTSKQLPAACSAYSAGHSNPPGGVAPGCEITALDAVASERHTHPQGLQDVSHDSGLKQQVMHCLDASAPQQGCVEPKQLHCHRQRKDLLEPSHKIIQGCIEHLEVRACGTTGGASIGSSHDQKASQDLGDALSVNLSENPTQSPEHLHCEEQPSGSWNLSAFDEAAAQMQQGSEKSPHLTSALNDDYEYCLPPNLKLVGAAGEEGGEKLNTAFERRVLRRLERFLNNLPSAETETVVEETTVSVDDEVSGSKINSDTASTGCNDSITFALRPPAPGSNTTPMNTARTDVPQLLPSEANSSSAGAAFLPPVPCPHVDTARSGTRHHWHAVQPQLDLGTSAMQPSRCRSQLLVAEVSQAGGGDCPPKFCARKLLESSGMVAQSEPTNTAKIMCLGSVPFQLLPPLEERASQEFPSVSPSATLSCSTPPRSLDGLPKHSAHSGNIKDGLVSQHTSHAVQLGPPHYVPSQRMCSRGDLALQQPGENLSATSQRSIAGGVQDEAVLRVAPSTEAQPPAARRPDSGALGSTHVATGQVGPEVPSSAAAGRFSLRSLRSQVSDPTCMRVAASAREALKRQASSPPVAVPRSLQSGFAVPFKPRSAVAGWPPRLHDKPQVFSSTVTSSFACSREAGQPAEVSSQCMHASHASCEFPEEVAPETTTPMSPSANCEPNMYQNSLFRSQSRRSEEQQRSPNRSDSTPLPPSHSMHATGIDGEHSVQDRNLRRPPRATAAAFYRSHISPEPIVCAVNASSDCLLAHSESGQLRRDPKPPVDGNHAVLESADLYDSNVSLEDPVETSVGGGDGAGSDSCLHSSSNLYMTAASTVVPGWMSDVSCSDTRTQPSSDSTAGGTIG